MRDRHGDGWSSRLMAQIAEGVEDGPEEEGEVAAQPGTVPPLERASAGATETERPTSLRRGQTEVSPGSGHMPVVGSPGSGQRPQCRLGRVDPQEVQGRCPADCNKHTIPAKCK